MSKNIAAELLGEIGASIYAIVPFGRMCLNEVIRLGCGAGSGGVGGTLLTLLAVLTILTTGNPSPTPTPTPIPLPF
jgi:hypothetical protein